MSQKTILVIDDSSTIRRLVDGHLGSIGYSVVLAPTAEEGLDLAHEVKPDMILLDHQLPGTTGCEVCRSLVEDEELRKVPVVVSSTLRKRAYIEYSELANVVDMLPKPYSPELLETTVSNALETGTLIVDSQSQGTAVPEVIDQLCDASLSGGFDHFSLREVIDFVNNGVKPGVLEVCFDRFRVWIYVNDGRIQAVTATGINVDQLTRTLPDGIRDLAPVFKTTLSAHQGSSADSLVELLNNNVLDPRLLRRLLRHQAAVLTHRCFHDKPSEFRFHATREAPSLFQSLPLEISLTALLVEGALFCEAQDLPSHDPLSIYARQTVRGQNLDRSGLSPTHMKILTALNQPLSSEALAQLLDWPPEQVRRVLHGLCLAGLIEARVQAAGAQVIAYEPDAELARPLRQAFLEASDSLDGKVVRDALALKLLLRRQQPHVVVFGVKDEAGLQTVQELARQREDTEAGSGKWLAVADPQYHSQLADLVDVLLQRPLAPSELLNEIRTSFEHPQPVAV